MANKARVASKIFILSWLIIPLLAIWISTNYIIGLNRNPTWNASSNQELVKSVAESAPPHKQITWDHNSALITLWFDDAWSTQYEPGYTLMQQHKFVGSLAVPTQAVGTDGYMNWAQIKAVQHEGWEITSHSQSHNCKLKDLTDSFEDKELKGSKNDLNSHGIYADNYVAPCGVITPLVSTVSKRYYSSLRTSVSGTNPLPVKDPYNLKVHTILRDTTIDEVTDWIGEAKATNTWLILVFHQIDDNTTEFGTNKAMLQQSLDAVQASKIPVVLPNQVLQMKVNQ